MKIIGKGRVKRTISNRNRIEELAQALGSDFRLNDRTEARRLDNRRIPKAVTKDEINDIDLAGTYDDLYERAESIKQEIGEARSNLNQLNEVLSDVDEVLTTSVDPTEVDDAYNTIVDLLNELRDTSDILEEAQNIRTTMDKVRRQYVEECYKFVQKVRKAVNNDNSKYAVKWSNEAKKIINAYIPGKNFSNYLPDGVE
jgi:vacuolar-type H+-ATPase subunit I/STV1